MKAVYHTLFKTFEPWKIFLKVGIDALTVKCYVLNDNTMSIWWGKTGCNENVLHVSHYCKETLKLAFPLILFQISNKFCSILNEVKTFLIIKTLNL